MINYCIILQSQLDIFIKYFILILFILQKKSDSLKKSTHNQSQNLQ
jgi:hypothetical protein